VIDAGKETRATLAIAYASRGSAFDGKGEFDRAIADYSKAIETGTPRRRRNS
jgi:hypothetical protein